MWNSAINHMKDDIAKRAADEMERRQNEEKIDD